MAKLSCDLHPEQEVFLKVTIHRSYVDAYGRPLVGFDQRRKKYNLHPHRDYSMFVCIADMEGDVCDDLVGKEGDEGIIEVLKKSSKRKVKRNG